MIIWIYIDCKILLLLKKEKQIMFLWSKMSLLRVSQTLMYVSILGYSWFLANDLEKVNQSEWYGASTTLSSSSLEELEMVQIKDYGGS